MTTGDPPIRLADGREVSTEDLVPILYEDLRRLADGIFRGERPSGTLQPTALVHEAYLALADQDHQTWENRAHFLAIAATAMRRIVINAAKARGRAKRGGGWQRITLTGKPGESPADIDLLDLETTLEKLGAIKERYVRIVELRYFAGLGLEEVASVLGVSRTIIVREWKKARAWLATELQDLGPDD